MTIIHLQRYSRFPSINIDAYIKAIIFVFCTCTFNTGVYGYTSCMHQLFDNIAFNFVAYFYLHVPSTRTCMDSYMAYISSCHKLPLFMFRSYTYMYVSSPCE